MAEFSRIYLGCEEEGLCGEISIKNMEGMWG